MPEQSVLEGFEKNLGELIDAYSEQKTMRQFHEKEAEKFSANMAEIEARILQAMADQHLEQAAHGGTIVRPKEHTYAHVEDWSKFYDFIEKERYFHLLEKRVSVTGYRELLDLGRQVPGVVPFVKTKLSVTKSAR